MMGKYEQGKEEYERKTQEYEKRKAEYEAARAKQMQELKEKAERMGELFKSQIMC